MKILFKTLSLGVLTLFGFSFSLLGLHHPSGTHPFSVASAREDEDEDHEEEDEDENEDDEEHTETKKSSKPKTIKVVKEVVEYKPVTETVIVTEEAYAKDTDDDKLVDAIDPDPTIPQKEYFTDTDNDGVPNALDQHHDEDDFAYYEFETDDNQNGILDSYE